MTSLQQIAEVVIGAGTHVHTHSAAVVDVRTGGVLAEITVTADAGGYQELLDFAGQHSGLRAWAIEGTGGHGNGLARVLAGLSEVVIELDRPERAKRRNGAKSDPLDAVRAAREALSRDNLGTPRAAGDRQALSVLLAARQSTVQAAGDAQRQLFSLVIAAPEPLRKRFRGHKLPAMTRRAARLRGSSCWDTETATTAAVLRDLARRALDLTAEAARHKKDIRAIVATWRPGLLTQRGVGPITAAVVLCAWSHPGRVRSEAAFAMLGGSGSGTAPKRFRLNRYGDRQLNRALHTITLSRLRYDPTTQAYTKRRTAERKTPPRHQTLPQALHRPRHLPAPRAPNRHLTSIGASGRQPLTLHMRDNMLA